MATETRINEIFTSIQGEGPYVGYEQLFIRFCGCNLQCDYCDTDFKDGKIFTPQKLYDFIKKDLDEVHSVSLTGGEPLLSYRFLQEFLPLIKDKTKIYLETNATLSDEFKTIKSLVDIVSADIKLPSATAKDTFNLHRVFLENCVGIETFAKIVFDKNITDTEISQCAKMGKELGIELVLQPKMNKTEMSVSSEFCNQILSKFIKLYSHTRLVPQVHKFLGVI